jgi:hypothetical protein
MIEVSGSVPPNKVSDPDPVGQNIRIWIRNTAVIKNVICKLHKKLPVIQTNMEFLFYVICHHLGYPGSAFANKDTDKPK